jgi:hypothetical protein
VIGNPSLFASTTDPEPRAIVAATSVLAADEVEVAAK